MRLFTLTTCLLAASALDAIAQVDMEEIVVTATRTEKAYRSTPYSISVLNKKELQRQTSDQLGDVMRNLPGLFVADAGQAGQKRIRIRGEDARRMALLIDGQEFIDHREVGVPLLVDTANISRIELVRGPASVLYGPKAMGGVINVITEDVRSDPFGGNLSVLYDGATRGQRYSAGVGGRVADTDWQLSLSSSDQDNRRSPDGLIPNTRYESRGYAASLHHQLGDHRFGIGYEDFTSSSGVFVEPEVRFTPPFLDFAIDIPVRDRNKLRVDYRFDVALGALQSFKFDAYRQISDREFNTNPVMQLAPGVVQDSSIGTLSQLVSNGFNVQSDWLFAHDHSVVLGFQHLNDRADEMRHRVVKTNGVVSTTEDIPDQAALTTDAVYIQDDWAMAPSLSLLAGIRFYDVSGKHELSGRNTTLPSYGDRASVRSLALVYDLSPEFTLRANLSEGYIFPSLMNLAVGAYAGSRFINPVSSLNPETSLTRELGLRFAGDDLNVDATLFLTTANDYIDHIVCAAIDPCLTSRDEIYKNVGKARSFGLELSGQYVIPAGQLYSNVTWMKRRKQYEGVDTYDSGIPELAGQLGVRLALSQSGDVDVFARFESSSSEGVTSSRGTYSAKEYPGFVTVNADVSWSWDEQYHINLSLGNLLDKRYHFATENLLASGRNASVRFRVDI